MVPSGASEAARREEFTLSGGWLGSVTWPMLGACDRGPWRRPFWPSCSGWPSPLPGRSSEATASDGGDQLPPVAGRGDVVVSIGDRDLVESVSASLRRLPAAP